MLCLCPHFFITPVSGLGISYSSLLSQRWIAGMSCTDPLSISPSMSVHSLVEVSVTFAAFFVL